jgi:hypothetical protein
VLPLDVYLENEIELAQAATTGEIVDGLEGTVGAKLLKRDPESRVVVNFHGVSSSILILFWVSSFFCSQRMLLSSTVFNLPTLLLHGLLTMNFLCIQCFVHFVNCKLPPSVHHLIISIERRPCRPRPPPVNLSLHLWHPTYPPFNLRLPRLRSI